MEPTQSLAQNQVVEATCRLHYIPRLDAIPSLGRGTTSFRTEDGNLKQVKNLPFSLFFTRSRASHVIMKPKISCGDLGSGWVM